jgi:hypothetical protein
VRPEVNAVCVCYFRFFLKPQASSLTSIMQKFVDRAGRIWIVDIDNTTLRRVKTLTGVHLLEAIDGDLITRLSTDPLLLGDVLFAICKPQADQQQITDEAFGEGLAGNSIDDATGALLEALINYFPESRRRLLRKAAEKQKAAESKLMIAAEKRLDDPRFQAFLDDLEKKTAEEFDRKLQTLSDSSSDLPASSESIQVL